MWCSLRIKAISVKSYMRNNPQEAAKWDWLADPNAALELYSIERRAFYNWQVAEREWSKATNHMASSGPDRLTKEQRNSLDALKNRLDEAAQAYDQARQKLHKAWSA